MENITLAHSYQDMLLRLGQPAIVAAAEALFDDRIDDRIRHCLLHFFSRLDPPPRLELSEEEIAKWIESRLQDKEREIRVYARAVIRQLEHQDE